MAGPIMHIVLALKIIALLPSTINVPEFIVGTSFPDIRYMAKLSRNATHIEPVSWQDVVKETSSFRAGMLFHNLVDNFRMHYFEQFFYDRYSHEYSPVYMQLYPLIMKAAEDSVLYDMIFQWPEILTYFDTIYEQEKLFCSLYYIQQWHQSIKNYCRQKPSLETINTFILHTGGLSSLFNIEDFDSINTFKILLNDKNFHAKLLNFYITFETMLLDTNSIPNDSIAYAT